MIDIVEIEANLMHELGVKGQRESDLSCERTGTEEPGANCECAARRFPLSLHVLIDSNRVHMSYCEAVSGRVHIAKTAGALSMLLLVRFELEKGLSDSQD